MALAVLLQAAAFAQGSKAWVWVNNPSSPTSTPPPAYQFNSSGGVNRVVRLAAGHHLVELPGLGVSGGTVQVTAYGGSHFCNIERWSPSGNTQQVFVKCYTSTGAPFDGRFTLLFYKERRGRNFDDAYLWANLETAASGIPDRAYQWNSNGPQNSVRRLGQGHYEVFLPAINVAGDIIRNGGTVQVSAYGSVPRHAMVQGWMSGPNGITVRVNTFDATGNDADAKFTLSFMTDVAVGTSDTGDWLDMIGAFLWANKLTPRECYAPAPWYQFNNSGSRRSANICRQSVGSYQVILPFEFPNAKTTALVSAYGTEKNYCSIRNWSSDNAGGTSVNVECRNANGRFVDSMFTLLYLTDASALL